jgi:hypothetical protein
MAVEPCDRRRDRALKRADQIAHVLGIELRRQRRRADKIAKHYRELAAFPYIYWGCRGRSACRLGFGLHPAQTCNRLEETLAVPQRNSKLTEIAIGQVGQNVNTD